MATKLYFLRHGLAGDTKWENDELRPLTDEGMKRMEREAKYLKHIKLELDRLITSPLVRARDTAKYVGEALDIKVHETPLLKPGFDMAALRTLLKQHESAKKIMIVGHEPDFSRVISVIIGGGSVKMKKGGLARVDLDRLDPPRGELVWLLTARLLGVND